MCVSDDDDDDDDSDVLPAKTAVTVWFRLWMTHVGNPGLFLAEN